MTAAPLPPRVPLGVSGVPLRMLGVAGAAERPMLIEAGRQLATCLSGATGGECTVALSFAMPDDVAPAAGGIVVMSLLGEVASGVPIAQVGARWHDRVGRLAGADGTHVVIATVYRYVADPAERGTATERIRRLNDLAIALSRAHGAQVADIDTAFALIGTAVVKSDYRCAGPHAAFVAGHVVAAAVLAADLSAHLPGPLQERACAALGTLDDLLKRHRQDAP